MKYNDRFKSEDIINEYESCYNLTELCERFDVSSNNTRIRKYFKDVLIENNVAIKEVIKRSPTKISDEDLFRYGSKGSSSWLKERVFKSNLLDKSCAICGITEWNGKHLSLHLDHIDGNSKNNDISNLRLLCPNCHSQTITYTGRNRSRAKLITCESCNKVVRGFCKECWSNVPDDCKVLTKELLLNEVSDLGRLTVADKYNKSYWWISMRVRYPEKYDDNLNVIKDDLVA